MTFFNMNLLIKFRYFCWESRGKEERWEYEKRRFVLFSTTTSSPLSSSSILQFHLSFSQIIIIIILLIIKLSISLDFGYFLVSYSKSSVLIPTMATVRTINYPSLISNFWFILHLLIWFQNFPPFIQFSKSLILKKKSQTLAQKELERLLLPLSMFENSAFFYDEQFCLFLVVCTREIERDHCQNLGNGMRLILPRLKDSLSFSIKLVMTRRPRKPLSQDLRVLFHLQEMKNLQRTTTTITTVIPKPHDQRYFLFQIELDLDKSRLLTDIRFFSA